LQCLSLAEAVLSTSFSARKTLRKIPALRSLSGQELEGIRDRLVYRSYSPGEVLWRTRGPVGFLGFIQSGEIEVEYRVSGILIRSRRLSAGDSVPPRSWQMRSRYAGSLARAVTGVSLALVPEAQLDQARQRQSARVARTSPGATSAGSPWLRRAWPLLLLLLIVWLGRADIVRIASGLLFIASSDEQYYPPYDTRSMSLLKYAEQVDPGAAFVYNEEGYRWFQQEKLPDAEAAFGQAVDRDPANAPALNNMAITHFTLGDLPAAARLLQEAAQQDPDNAIVRYNLGIILMQKNDHARAIREFRQAGFIDPNAASPPLQQAFLYAQAGDDRNAESGARTAIQRDPSQASAHLLLAIALYRQDRDTEALVSIADSLALEPENRVARFYQALILARRGHYDVALPILESLLATAPDDLEAARISVEIEAIHRSLSGLEAGAR